jgi:hypothetical protein
MTAYEKWSRTHIPVRDTALEMNEVANSVDSSFPGSVLILAFEKSKTSAFFKHKQTHTNVEMFLIPTQAPTTGGSGLSAKSYQFSKSDILAVHIDKSGVKCDLKRVSGISSHTHDLLCISLTHIEKIQVVDFIHAIKNCKYNTLDALLCGSICNVSSFFTSDCTGADHGDGTIHFDHSIKKLHSGQLVTIIIQRCLENTRMKSKMWGYNSRFTTPHEVYKELHDVCLAINPGTFRQGYLQAWGIGISQNGPDKC